MSSSTHSFSYLCYNLNKLNILLKLIFWNLKQNKSIYYDEVAFGFGYLAGASGKLQDNPMPTISPTIPSSSLLTLTSNGFLPRSQTYRK